MTEEQLKDVNKALDFLGIKNVKNIIIISKDATNGEVIKAIFPNIEIIETVYVCGMPYVRVLFNGMPEIKIFDLDWWNAPYKAESED